MHIKMKLNNMTGTLRHLSLIDLVTSRARRDTGQTAQGLVRSWNHQFNHANIHPNNRNYSRSELFFLAYKQCADWKNNNMDERIQFPYDFVTVIAAWSTVLLQGMCFNIATLYTSHIIVKNVDQISFRSPTSFSRLFRFWAFCEAQ